MHVTPQSTLLELSDACYLNHGGHAGSAWGLVLASQDPRLPGTRTLLGHPHKPRKPKHMGGKWEWSENGDKYFLWTPTRPLFTKGERERGALPRNCWRWNYWLFRRCSEGDRYKHVRVWTMRDLMRVASDFNRKTATPNPLQFYNLRSISKLFFLIT